MQSPLSVDKQTVKEFKISPELDVTPQQKLSFLQDQLHEIKSMWWRARVDVIHATRLQESKIEALRMKGNNNLVEHKNQVEQFTGAIHMLNTMIEELRKEYPELQLGA